MKNIFILLTLIVPILLWAAPKEQDRAILEKGDRELLPNPGFEGRLSGWTKTGSSTLTLESAAPASGKLHGKWDPSATGEFLSSDSITVPVNMRNRNICSMDFEYKWAGVAGEIKAQIYDGASVLAEVALDPSATDWRPSPPLMVTCPASGTIAWRLESTADAALIEIDNAHLGKLKKLDVSQTEIIGTAFYPATAACFWQTVVGPTLADFAVDADCPVPTVGGKASAPATKIPAITFDELPAGKYQIDVTGFFLASQSTSANASCAYAISDGTNRTGLISVFGDINQGAAANSSTSGLFEYTSAQTNVTFSIVAARNTGNGTCYLSNEIADSRELEITVTKYPLSSAEAITLETTGWHIDANIGGGNAALSATTEAAYIPLAGATLDLVLNPGSATARIPCASSEDASGLTCTANEQLGIDFDIPSAGRYKVCAEFAHFIDLGAATSVAEAVFQLVETPNTAETLTQQGNSRITSSWNTGAGVTGAWRMANPINICGDFQFSSVGKKTIRLMYEQQVAGTVTSNLVFANRDAVAGQRDFHITVEKMDQQFPTPVFTDLTNSLNKKIEVNDTTIKGCGFSVADTETPVLSDEYGNCITSITDTGSSQFRIDWDAGFYADNSYKCHCSIRSNGGSNYDCILRNKLTASIEFLTKNSSTGAAVPSTVDVMCFGK